jgi:hypothetical protein
MKKNLCGIFAFVICLALIACHKSDKKPSNTSLVTSTTWKYSDAGIDQDNNGTKDFSLPPGTLQSCDLDNTITFKSDGTGVVDEGATKCDAADPQTIPFTWNFTNNETTINFSTAVIAGIGGEAKIIELSSNKLTLSKQVNYSGVLVTVIVFLTH